MRELVTIETLGHRGDGIARSANGPVFVPFSLPGERVLVERSGDRARLIEVVEPSPERRAPTCRHFGACGGCALQMLPLAATRELKHGFVASALARQGLEVAVDATIGVALSSRRRAVMTAKRVGDDVWLGYSERGTNSLVDVGECPVLAPPLADALPAIKTLLRALPIGRKPVRMTALLTRTGIDLSLDGPLTSYPTPRLVELARAARLTRLSIDGEPVITFSEPLVDIAGVALKPPPGAFLQASAEAETIMSRLVVEHFAPARHAADLFSGVGTFALVLARRIPVRAVEMNAPALDALSQAARRAAGLKRVETERRNLFAFPLAPAELNAFDAVVFDPPRAGASAQAAALAASKVPLVAAISCDPASFARDARILVDGGYVLERVVPIDQFVFSAETEVVGLFRLQRS